MVLKTALAAALLFVMYPGGHRDTAPQIAVRLTQKYLVAVCVDGVPVDAGERRLLLDPGQHTLAFTMRNSPRPGRAGGDVSPGIAVVQVVLEAKHKYEIEIRADAMTYSSRVWTKGGWKPVVRDRTEDRIISGEPDWSESDCKTPAVTPALAN
jgi:hypothetical protein